MVSCRSCRRGVHARIAGDGVVFAAADDVLDAIDQQQAVIGVLQHIERQIDLDAAAAAADEAEIDRVAAGAAIIVNVPPPVPETK